MKVIAGLGNPGVAYEKTRHNAGYQALDALAGLLSVRVTKRGFSGEYGEGIFEGGRVLLIKPTTYMNLSGDCVSQVLHYYKVLPQNLTVLYDDIDLPLGSLRIREHGSAGTHNGMRSVIACLGTEEFARIRIGVGRQTDCALKDFVLSKPSKEEQELLSAAFRNAAEAAKLILAGRMSDAQARYNKKHEGSAAAADPSGPQK